MWGQPPIHARLLGEPAFRWRNDPIRPPSRKAGAMLLALSLNREGLSRPEIAELLWGAGKTHNVRQALYVLRRLPGVESWLDPGERVRVAARTDIERFEDAVDAGRFADALQHWRVDPATLWREEILAGPEAFADWLELQRERLEAAYLECLQCRAVELEDDGAPREALEVVDRVLALDPLNESAHRGAIRLELRLGDAAAALERFERCRRVLLEELGVEPLEKTRALVADVPLPRSVPAAAPDPRPEPGPEPAPAPIPVPAPAPAPAPASGPARLPGRAMGLRDDARRRAPFLGRARELAWLDEAVASPETTVVTVAGEGGSGKTRLAIEFAARRRDAFPDGVATVALAPVDHADALLSAVAAATGVALDGRVDPEAQLRAALAPRRMLLLVDNLEHLLDGSGPLVTLAEACPGLRLLCTSREPLGVVGERVLRLDGLPLPERVDAPHWHDNDAVRLFVATARRGDPRFALSEADRPAVQRVLELVGGLPLAIELAAPWTASLRPAEIADELARSLDALRSEDAEVPPRHASMQAAFDHSWALLSDAERAALAGVAAFRAPFEREGAERVAGASLRVLLALDRKSLVRRADGSGFTISEVVRAAAWDRVADEGAVRARHARFFAGRMEAWSPRLDGPDMATALEGIEGVLDDVRTAWDWATAAADDEVLRACMDAYHRALEVRGLSAEGERAFGAAAAALEGTGRRAATAAALRSRQAGFAILLGRWRDWPQRLDAGAAASEAAGEPAEAAFAHTTAGFARYHQGELDEAEASFARALDAAEAAAAPRHAATAHVGLGTVALARGAFEDALRAFGASRALARRAGDARAEARAWINEGIALAAGRGPADGRDTLEGAVRACRALGDPRMLASALNNFGRALHLLGDLGGALAALEECAALRERLGDPRGAALAQANLGHLQHQRGELDEARRWLERARQGFTALHNDLGLALTLNRLGRLAWSRGRPAEAERDYLEALPHAQASGDAGQCWDVATGMAYLAEDAGRSSLAAGLYAAVLANLTERGFTREDVARRLEALRSTLPPARLARALCWAEALTWERLRARWARRAARSAAADPAGRPTAEAVGRPAADPAGQRAAEPGAEPGAEPDAAAEAEGAGEDGTEPGRAGGSATT